jgi:hypothetical protein
MLSELSYFKLSKYRAILDPELFNIGLHVLSIFTSRIQPYFIPAPEFLHAQPFSSHQFWYYYYYYYYIMSLK